MPVWLYDCETWSLRLKEEFAKGIRRQNPEANIWAQKMRVGGSGEDPTMSLYCSPNIVRMIKSRRLRWAGHVARMEEGRSTLKILTGKSIR